MTYANRLFFANLSSPSSAVHTLDSSLTISNCSGNGLIATRPALGKKRSFNLFITNKPIAFPRSCGGISSLSMIKTLSLKMPSPISFSRCFLALIFVLIEEFHDNPDLASDLRRHLHRDIGDPAFEVSRFQQLWHRGLNLYRLKYWDEYGGCAPYRIIYADNPRTDQIHILGIVHRNINYDTSHPTFHRIIHDYGRLGI